MSRLTMADFDCRARLSSVSHTPVNFSRADKILSEKYNPASLVQKGCELFAQFDRYHLVEQHRSKFPDHIKFITDLSKGNPITINTIRQQYKPLTAQTVCDDSQKWQFAPILVASNQERINITYQQCLAFAEAHNTHVYHWRVHSSKWQNAPSAEID